MLEGLLELRWVGELDPIAVDHRAGVALTGERLEEVDELALLLLDDRCEDLVPRALLELHEVIRDLLDGLSLDDLTADRAVRYADARPQEAQVVVDLRDRADGRARVPVGRLLIDRDSGAQALDEVDVWTIDLPEELPRVRRERLHVAALPLGEDRVERK